MKFVKVGIVLLALGVGVVVASDSPKRLPLSLSERMAIERLNDRQGQIAEATKQLEADSAALTSEIRIRLKIEPKRLFSLDPQKSSDAPNGAIVLGELGK